MSFFFESKAQEKKRLYDERRARETAEAAELEELPLFVDHSGALLARLEAEEAEALQARILKERQALQSRILKERQERAAAEAEAADIAAEIPEARVARKLLIEYWKKMNDYKKENSDTNGFYKNFELNHNRPTDNYDKVYQACQAAAEAYQRLGNMEKYEEYDNYATDVYMTMRKNDSTPGPYILRFNSGSSGGKKSKYSRKLKLSDVNQQKLYNVLKNITSDGSPVSKIDIGAKMSSVLTSASRSVAKSLVDGGKRKNMKYTMNRIKNRKKRNTKKNKK